MPIILRINFIPNIFIYLCITLPKTKKVISMSANEKISQVCNGLDMLYEDNSIPRNIRRGAEEVKNTLLNNNDPLDVRVASATSRLDELANDPNIPLHGRVRIWNIMSQLEEIV
jgi:uncharacterized protein (UPF0147 family)